MLLLLASGFGLAALWQSRHLGELQAQQREAWEVSDGVYAETESGKIKEGWATVVVGRPSGVAPLEFARETEEDERDGPVAGSPGPLEPAVDDGFYASPELGDFEMEVQPGQTLSGIAHAHYGTAPVALVEALATYNGLENPNALQSGATVLLPELSLLVDDAGDSSAAPE